MTTPFERTKSLVWAGDFLEEIRKSTTAPSDIKEMANRILRHYPSSMEIGSMAENFKNSIADYLDPEAVPDDIRKGYRR
jgi:hypothetical protein